MKYEIEKWSIGKLLELLNKGKIILNPPYQRNPIWTKKSQKELINSVWTNSPIPNIFLLKKGEVYEMVDGQQRTRAFFLYSISNEIDLTDNDKNFKSKAFLQYQIPVTIITHLEEFEHIEDFYDKVNSSGLRLNRPETIKGRFFDTRFYRLVEELTSISQFEKLEIIPMISQKRMMDRDLVEELSALIIFGITDKKIQVDKLYQTDINETQEELIRITFINIISKLTILNNIKQIKNTRYRQRNDFYTLFGFIKDSLSLTNESFKYFYRLLLELESEIRPSKDACKILAEYAFNCVSQSNSSKARQLRINIFNEILLNQNNIPNESQSEVFDYYSIDKKELIKIESFFTFDISVLHDAITRKKIAEEKST